MPIAFLTPLFLAGLALLAVPIYVHLRNRERKELVEFPSLMFLRRIPYRSVRRQRIRNWPLFLLRVLALVLLAAAVARPGGMGMGDVKLALLLGFAVGRSVPVALAVALLAGAVPGLVLVARHGRRARGIGIPFAPCLALGGLVALSLLEGFLRIT